MQVNNQWDSLDDPPDVPLITGSIKTKSSRRESLSEAMSGTAIAFAKVITNQKSEEPTPTKKCPGQPLPTGVSPASKAKLSREYIIQLKELQELRECGVLSQEEFQEQKKFALDSIRSMNRSRVDDM